MRALIGYSYVYTHNQGGFNGGSNGKNCRVCVPGNSCVEKNRREMKSSGHKLPELLNSTEKLKLTSYTDET